MNKYFRRKFRIVTDRYRGYEVQEKPWYSCSWREYVTNTHDSIESAESFIELRKEDLYWRKEIIKTYDK